MKLLFIFNDAPRCVLEAGYTGAMTAISRRTVEMELTPEQAERIKRTRLGTDCGRPVFESLESITLMEPQP